MTGDAEPSDADTWLSAADTGILDIIISSLVTRLFLNRVSDFFFGDVRFQSFQSLQSSLSRLLLLSIVDVLYWLYESEGEGRGEGSRLEFADFDRRIQLPNLRTRLGLGDWPV